MSVRPLQHRIGTANQLTEVKYLSTWLGLHRKTAFQLLRRLRVPLIYIGKDAYFNLHTLDRVLYYLNRLAGVGFAAPGSTFKNKKQYRKTNTEHPSFEITAKDIKAMSDPVFVAEWLAIGSSAAGPGKTYVSTLKKKLKGVAPS